MRYAIILLFCGAAYAQNISINSVRGPCSDGTPVVYLAAVRGWKCSASTGITSLNGLTGPIQTFATGTTGSDFGISSIGTTHTFNLPTASGANRGLLSSADWTTFNNKGSGTVTSISAGTGITLTPNPIIATGSVALTVPVVVSSGGTNATSFTGSRCIRSNAGGTALEVAAADCVAGAGITSLGGETGTTQTFSRVNDTNVTLTIASAADDHGFTMGWTGTLAAARLNANVVQSVVNDTNVTGSIATQALTLGWTGTLAIARGGTASATSQAAINALSQLTTEGDLLFHNGANSTRLPRGADTECLTSTATTLDWAACSSGSGTVTSAGTSFTGGLISIGGTNPVTTSGTMDFTVAGTSGGIPYFSGAATWASSGALGAGQFVLGGGAGTTPTTSFSVVPVANGGTGLASGTSGGVLAYTAAGTLASSGALTANLPVIGGGAGVAPSVGTRSGNTTKFTTMDGSAPATDDCAKWDANDNLTTSGAACGGSGTVTSVGQTFTGGLISVAGTPVTTSGTLALTVAGTSGGVPYFNSASTWATSGALTANLPVIGGGAGAAPAVGTRSGNTTAYVTTTGAQTNGDCVKIDASGNHIANGSACGGGTNADLQVFNLADSGTNWTLPTNGKIITVTICGAGGGGGGGEGAATNTARTGGAGGAGGFCTTKVFRAADITSPVAMTIGAGGLAGTAGSSSTGGDGGIGGNSTFGTYLTGYGGGGGGATTDGGAGGGGAGCHDAGTNSTAATNVVGGDCFLAGANGGATQTADFRGAGSSTAGTSGANGNNSYGGGGSGCGSATAGAALAAAANGGMSMYSGGGGGCGGGVNAANPGTAQSGSAGGNTGQNVVPLTAGGGGGGGTAGNTASACGAGGEGQNGAALNTLKPGGQGGGGGASKNSTTGCNGGNGGVGGGGGGGGGAGTSVGGAGGTGGNGYAAIWTQF